VAQDEFLPDNTFSDADRMQRDSYITQPLETIVENPHSAASGALGSSRAAGGRRGWAILWRGTLGVLLAGGLLAGAGALYYQATFADRIYPNISVQGTNLGLAQPEDARSELVARYQPFLDAPLTLSFHGTSWQPTHSEVGLRLEIEQAIEQAFGTGRKQDLVGNVREVAAVWEHGLELPVAMTIDQPQLQRYLAKLAGEVERAPVDAKLLIEGVNISVVPAQEGRQLLVDETLADITAALQSLSPQQVALRTRALPPLLGDAEAERAADEARAYIQGALQLSAEEQTWEVTPETLAGMLRQRVVSKPDGTRTIEVSFDPAGFEPLLDEIDAGTGYDGTNPRIDWNGGDLRIISDGTPGLKLDKDKARELLAEAVRGESRAIALPFKEVPPKVNQATLGQLGIKELIAVGQSDFSGSAAYRITNVVNGMRLLNGIVLAPDEEFSFNKYIGEIDAVNGFVEGYAIIQNRTQLEYGGGICQDSTTMFRAAFWAGLPITERWGHSFYISWYDMYGYGEYGNGPGMDATIFTGGPDLKFVNDTGNYLLIQSYANPNTGLAEVAMYGTKPNRTVEFIGPEIRNRVGPPSAPVFVPDPKQPRGALRQSDTARGGMDIYFSRVIVENGVRQAPEQFVTAFKPWPNIYVHNPADTVYYDPERGISVTPFEPEPTPEATPGEGGDPATSAPPEGQQPAEPAPPAPSEGQPFQPAEPAPAPPAEPAPPVEGQPVGGVTP
jgi:vancomycin resistance protein YoaR